MAPAPFAGLTLADLGASVIRIDRADDMSESIDVLHRSKRSIALNLKTTEGISIAKKLLAEADVVIDPFRPGALGKLGLGPVDLMKVNKKVVYGRLMGYVRLAWKLDL